MPTTCVPEHSSDTLPRTFVTTHWSVVLSAKQGTAEEVYAALGKLCHIYRLPLYYFIRRRGHAPHDAEDLTQDFFEMLIDPDFLRTVDPSKGRFRSFLLAALGNLLSKDRRYAKAQKRGGKFTFVSIDAESAEQQYLQVPDSGLSPEQLFEQQWAIALFSEVTSRLKEEYISAGKGAQFEAIKIFLTGEKQAASYQELATKLETTTDALKMAVSRMRKRYRELLRVEIAKTVNDPAEIDEELRALHRALSS